MKYLRLGLIFLVLFPFTGKSQTNDGFDLRCESFGKALCDFQTIRKPYDYKKDESYLRMIALLKEKGIEPMFAHLKGLDTLDYVERIENDLFARAPLSQKELSVEFEKMASQLPGTWPGQAQKDSIEKVVSESIVLSLGEAIKLVWKTKFNDEAKKFFTKDWAKTCNAEAEGIFSYNAYRYENFDKPSKKPILDIPAKQLIIYCPGIILNALKNSKTKEEMVQMLTFSIGHELTHNFDFKLRPDLHETWVNCINKNYDFNTIDSKLWDMMRKEISADVGGILLLTNRIASIDALKNYTELKRVFASGHCKRGKMTPQGMMRLNIIGRHPQMLKLMGCTEPKVPVCK